MLKPYLAWILALLFPLVEDLGGDPLVDPLADDDPLGDADPLGDEAPPAEPSIHELREQIRASTEAAQRLQREVEDLRRAAPQRTPPSAAPAQDLDSRLTEQEDQRLASPDITPLERWQIESNRSIRRAAIESKASREQVNATVAQLRDAQDKGLYEARAAADKIYKRYAERVEQRLMEMRRNGGDAPREVILRYLVGEDIMSGKMKRKVSPNAPGESTELAPARTPTNARSDVPRKPGNTERDKRRARLENVLI
jgi:hypothetical protein